MKHIEGYVKIAGSDLKTKAGALLTHLERLNAQLAEQDIIAQAEFDVNRGVKILELDAYRDSGKAWRDYSVAMARNVNYEPITWFGFIKVGERKSTNIYALSRSVEDFNWEFWSNIDWDVLENLTPTQLQNYNDYRLPYQAEVTKKHSLKFLEELMLLVSEPEIYLSIADYQKLSKLWAEHFETTELLVG